MRITEKLRRWLLRETYALPLDLFRAAVGLTAAAYFLRLLGQFSDFSGPDGLLDHALLYRIYWFAQLSLFQPGLSAGALRGLLALGVFCSVAVAAGWRVKPCAAAALALAASAARWNLLVFEIDDIMVQVFLLWMLVLPVGRTLTAGEALAGPRRAWKRWLSVRVPGAAARLLTLHVCLIYAVASLWKLTSPMWRGGFALYATLRLPIAYWPDLWGPASLPWLTAACWAALAAELSLPVLLLLPRKNPLKWLGLALQLGLHASIAAFIEVPLANLSLMASALLFFGDELMERLRAAPSEPLGAARGLGASGAAAAAILAVSLFSAARRAPVIGALTGPATEALWLGGVYEDFRLFNWIDTKNYRGSYRILWRGAAGPAREAPPDLLFPRSMSSSLLQSYLIGGLWIPVPPEREALLRASILRRAARRFCRGAGEDGTADVSVRVSRITPDNADLARGEDRFLMELRCASGRYELCRSFVYPELPSSCP